MAYSVESKKSGVTYYLHSRQSNSASATGKTKLYFFAKEIKTAEGTTPLDALPKGYTVIESALTGLPLLKREP